MSIIQSIRDKYAAVMIGIIALSLIGFLMMDAGRKGFGGGVSPTDAVGSINGTKISFAAFNSKVKTIEEAQQSNGRVVDEALRQQINAEVWRQMVEESLLSAEYDKLGVQVTDKEFGDLLFGDNPPDFLGSEFTDPNTGLFDANAAKQAIAQMKKSKGANVGRVEQFYLDPLLNKALKDKYTDLLQNSAYVPKFLVDKVGSDNAAMVSMQFITVPYTTIADSTIKVTDAMVDAYVGERPNEFKQEEATRAVSFVSFAFLPSKEDSSSVFNELVGLKNDFQSAVNPGAFVALNASTNPFADAYFSKTRIQIAAKDSIIATGLSNVYGPYLDGSSYVMSRIVDVKTLPDSVKARHILIGTRDPRTQQPILEDSIAKLRADSIEKAIKGGANFELLVSMYSTDEGSKVKGGDLGYFASGTMVKEFNDFCFEKVTGTMGAVKTQFGYHIIDIRDQKNFQPAYKIAYLARAINPSQETISGALAAANLFYGNSRKLKTFDDNVSMQNLNKLIAKDIKENDYTIMGLGVSRSLVKDVFSHEVGDVLEPVEIDNQFVVVAVTGAEKAGLMSAAKARPTVELKIMNKLKADIISKKLAGATSLDALATANNVVVQSVDSVSFVSPMINGVGFEPKVGGFAFATSNLNKVSAPVAGNSGVFVLKVSSVTANPTMGGFDNVKGTLEQQLKNSAAGGSIGALKKRASIVDKRAKFM